MINKYAIPNKYGFSRYRDIANITFTKFSDNTIDESKITYRTSNIPLEELTILMQPSHSKNDKTKEDIDFLMEFAEEQKDIILTFLGYNIAYAIYLNHRADRINAKADEEARFEADQLYRELKKTNKFLHHISFSIGKDEERESFRIKSTHTLRKILEAVEPIIKEQADKEKARIGEQRNSFRKKILQSLVPLFKYLENETFFRDKTKNEIAEWILNTFNPYIIEKYKNLDLDLIDSAEMLVGYRVQAKDIKYQMELV